MRFKARFLFFILLSPLVLFSSAFSSEELRGPDHIWIPALGSPNRVSLIQLISNPDAYHGKRVLVQGFVRFEHEDTALYLEKDSAEYLIAGNAVWLDFSPGFMTKDDQERFHGHYVMIQGVFRKDMHGHLGAFPGTIEGINGIKVLKGIKPSKALPEKEAK